MALRPRTGALLRRAGLSAALLALVVPASATTATADARSARTPVVTSVSPLSAAIGETITVRGRNFRRGRAKNTVAFRRDGGKAVFVKAGIGTTRMLRVTLTDRLASGLRVSGGAIVPTRMRIRVLSTRFGKSFTRLAISPLIGPRKPAAAVPPAVAPEADCDGDGLKNSADLDDDGDLLADDLEKRLTTDQCDGDSDDDRVTDGYEYKSAIDLNDDEYRNPQIVLPAPMARPYPNPRFADGDVDYDGDGLTLADEFSLWTAYRNPAAGLDDLVYSDGNQYSAYGRDPVTGTRPGPLVGPDPEAKYSSFVAWAVANGEWNINVPIHGVPTSVRLNDFDFSGGAADPDEARWYDLAPRVELSDDERDEDADGLTNYDETIGRLRAEFWTGCYVAEPPYPVVYAGTSLVDPDSDGDGVRDGADDQDHDDLPNLMELSRASASRRATEALCGGAAVPASNGPARGWVNPYNPCLPYTDSRTCLRHPPFVDLPAPFAPLVPKYNVFN